MAQLLNTNAIALLKQISPYPVMVDPSHATGKSEYVGAVAKEINRVVVECDPGGAGIELSLIQHISPITWDNVILYGEYKLDRNLLKI